MQVTNESAPVIIATGTILACAGGDGLIRLVDITGSKVRGQCLHLMCGNMLWRLCSAGVGVERSRGHRVGRGFQPNSRHSPLLCRGWLCGGVEVTVKISLSVHMKNL